MVSVAESVKVKVQSMKQLNNLLVFVLWLVPESASCQSISAAFIATDYLHMQCYSLERALCSFY